MTFQQTYSVKPHSLPAHFGVGAIPAKRIQRFVWAPFVLFALFACLSATAQAQTITSIATGGFHACALNSAGGVKCWGANNFGQLGDGSTTTRLTAVDVLGLTSGVAALAAGYYHTCAVTTAGGVKCWGYNVDAELGDGSTTTRLTAVDVTGLANGVDAITAGSAHTCALTTAGGVKCWGYNPAGQLGDGSTSTRLTA
jgi:alpha-tubulin suppressor-like RCC1 family protein